MDGALNGGAELALEIYRWQFGIVTVYHYLMVPLTLGLSFMVALMQTLAVRHRSRHWYAATRFFGKLLILNFAVGVATGIVQEFQFGMNWPEFSRYVGDIFGAPLGMEGMLAFFFESTFIGLWIFGWGQLKPKLHLLTIWMVALGANLSAVFIVGANSWMQHPVGSVFNPATGRAEVDGFKGIFQIATNWTIWMAVAHVIFTSWMVAGSLVIGTCLYHIRRFHLGESKTGHLLRPAAMMGTFFLLLGSLTTVISGHIQALQIATEQPMKFAAGEALCQPVEDGAPFVIAAFGNSCETLKTFGHIPYGLSLLASGSPNTKLNSVAEINDAYRAYFSQPENLSGLTDNYLPPLMATFWSFRFMVLFGFISFLVGLWVAFTLWKEDKVPSKFMVRVAAWAVPVPFLASMCGWMYTEIGRQPWIVHPNFDTAKASGDVFLLTRSGISGLSSVTSAVITTTVFVLLYLVLCVVWARLLITNAKMGLENMIRVPKKRPVNAAMRFGEGDGPARPQGAPRAPMQRPVGEGSEMPRRPRPATEGTQPPRRPRPAGEGMQPPRRRPPAGPGGQPRPRPQGNPEGGN